MNMYIAKQGQAQTVMVIKSMNTLSSINYIGAIYISYTTVNVRIMFVVIIKTVNHVKCY